MNLFSNKKKELDTASRNTSTLDSTTQEYLNGIDNQTTVNLLTEMFALGVKITAIPKRTDDVVIRLLHKMTTQKDAAFVNELVRLNFSFHQLKVIEQGVAEGVDVSYLLDPELRDKQMLAILDALKNGLNPSPLLDGDKSEMIMNNLVKRMLALKADGRFTERLNKQDLTDDEVLAMFSELNGKSEIRANGNLKKFTDFQMLFNGDVTGSVKTIMPFTGNLTSVGGALCDLDFDVIYDTDKKTYTVSLIFADTEVFRKTGVTAENPILIGDIHQVIKKITVNGEIVKADILISLAKAINNHKQFRLGSFNELNMLLSKILKVTPDNGVCVLMIDGQVLINAFTLGGPVSIKTVMKNL